MGYGGFGTRIGLLFLLALAAPAGKAIAQSCPIVGQLYSIDGQVEVRRNAAWQTGTLNQPLCAQDAVRTGSLSRAAVMLVNEAVLRIDQDTTVHLTDVTADDRKTSLFDLTKGAFQSFSRQPRALEVNTPYLNAAVQGTEFRIRVEADESILTVLEGTVSASNAHGSSAVGSGQSIRTSGGAPRPFILVQPRDSVQWGLYYPPILALSATGTTGLRPEFAASMERAANHDVAGAFAALEGVPRSHRDGFFYSIKQRSSSPSAASTRPGRSSIGRSPMAHMRDLPMPCAPSSRSCRTTKLARSKTPSAALRSSPTSRQPTSRSLMRIRRISI